MTRATRVFPQRLATRYLKAFLTEYVRHQPLDAGELGDYVACRFAHYDLANGNARVWSGRTAGLPVFRSTVRRLTRVLFDDGLAGIDPDLAILS